MFGNANGYGSSLNLSSIKQGDGNHGFTIELREGGYDTNIFASIAGDINGDGFDDIIVGDTTGQNYIIFGMARFDPVVDLGSLAGLG